MSTPSPTFASRSTFPIALAAILAMALGLRLAQPGADPPLRLSASNSEVVDGPWYAATAIAYARGYRPATASTPELGTPPGVYPSYDRRAYTLLARMTFALLGVSLESLQVLQAVLGTLLVGVLGVAVRHAVGPATGLIAALLLAGSYVAVWYARVPLVYGPLTTGLALVMALAVFAIERPVLLLPAWALVFLLTAGFAVHALLIAPALAVLTLAITRRKGISFLPFANVAVVFALATIVLKDDLLGAVKARAVAYRGDLDAVAIVKRSLRALFTTRLLSHESLVVSLAWLGAFRGLGDRWPIRREARPRLDDDAFRGRCLDLFCGLWMATWVGVLSLFEFSPQDTDTPLRHFFPALPPAVALAARVLERVRTGERVLEHTARPWLYLWSFLAAYWVVGGFWTAYHGLLAERLGDPMWLRKWVGFYGLLATAGVLGGLIGLVISARIRKRQPEPPTPGRDRVVAAVILAVTLLGQWAMTGKSLREAAFSRAQAEESLARTLAPGAILVGNWAHALTYRTPSLRCYLPTQVLQSLPYDARAGTHLLIDEHFFHGPVGQVFAEANVPLTPITRFEIRGSGVLLFRFPWYARHGYEPSLAEPP